MIIGINGSGKNTLSSMAIFYKGEDITMTFQSETSLAQYTTKVVKVFTPLTAPVTATVGVIDTYSFKATLTAAQTAAIKPGRLNVVIELTDADGKIISKTLSCRLADPYLDGSERSDANFIADIFFIENNNITVNFVRLPSVKQESGDSEIDVMSQKAVSDEFATKADHGYPTGETPKTLRQIEALIANIPPSGGGGEQVQLRTTATYIQWKYESEIVWRNLIAISDLVGPQGPQGPQGLQGQEGQSAYQLWLLQPGNAGKSVEEFISWLQQPSTAMDELINVQLPLKADHGYSADETPKTLKNVEQELQNTFNTVFQEVNEDGFYICDAAGNVMMKVTDSGLDAAQIGSALTAIIQGIAPTSPEVPSETRISSLSITGDDFVTIEPGGHETKTFTLAVLPENAKNRNVIWTCDNGDVIAQSDTHCLVEFHTVGFAVVRCVSLSDSMMFAKHRINVVDSSVVEQVNINYYYNTKPFEAEGEIQLISNTTRAYQLAWGDSTGILPQFDIFNGDDLTPTSQPLISLTAGVSKTVTVPKKVMIPEGVTRLYLIGNSNHFIEFEPFKLYDSTLLGTKRLTLGVLSDVHVTVEDTYHAISNDLPNAWSWFQGEGVNFIAGAGDLTDNGLEEQFTIFNNFWNGKAEVYSCPGNHDIQNSGAVPANWHARSGLPFNFVLKTGNPINNTVSADKREGVLFREDIPEDVVFIFLSLSNSYTSNGVSSSDRLWLEGVLPQYTDKKIFFFHHLGLDGVGGDVEGRYGHNESTTSHYQWLKPILDANPNMLYFHGHSHWRAYLSLVDPDLMYYEDSDESFKSLHCTSSTCSRITHKQPNEGEVMLLEIYDEYLITKTFDVTNNKLQPMGHQIIKL